MENPFKFGTLVDEPYFIDRKRELRYINQFLHSENHLIIISPRRYGKSSLIRKAVTQSGRPYVWVNMQQVVSREDFAEKLLKSVFKQYKFEHIKHLLKHFRVLPSFNVNPMTDEVTVSFQPLVDSKAVFEDSMSLLEQISTPERKLIVVFDEFQDVLEIDPHIDKELRAIMQMQEGLNYIFLGSQESMMTDIFERPKSAFYHFGELMRLEKIPSDELFAFLRDRLSNISDNAAQLAEEIITFTGSHPYYSQQLAYTIWNLIALGEKDKIFTTAVSEIVNAHDLDYERLWATFNKTDQITMRIVCSGSNPVQSRLLPTSTLTSSVKRLIKKGYILRPKKDNYIMEDPFFREWIIRQN